MFSRTTEAHGSVRRRVNNKDSCLSRPRFRLSIGERLSAAVLVLGLIAFPCDSLGQGKKKTKTPRKSEPTLADRVATAKAEVAAAANNYKASLEKLLALQENDVKTASETVERRKELLAQAIISKRELEESERALEGARSRVVESRRQLIEWDRLIAAATADKWLARTRLTRIKPPKRINRPSRPIKRRTPPTKGLIITIEN